MLTRTKNCTATTRMKLLLNYFSLLLIYTLMLASCADSNFMDKSQLNSSILMGKPVTKDVPLAQKIVFIAHNFEFAGGKFHFFGLCTGVVIADNLVLTAAHCLKNETTTRIITTTNIRDKNINFKNIYKIEKSIFRDSTLKAQTKNLNFDLAIVKLSHKIPNVDVDNQWLYQSPSAEIISTDIARPIEATIAGFGKTIALTPAPEQLEFAPINGTLNQAQVELQSAFLNKSIIELNQNLRPGVCSGDSGGPLFIRRYDKVYLQGLAVSVSGAEDYYDNYSTQIAANCNNKGYFINLDYHKNWINENYIQLTKY